MSTAAFWLLTSRPQRFCPTSSTRPTTTSPTCPPYLLRTGTTETSWRVREGRVREREREREREERTER